MGFDANQRNWALLAEFLDRSRIGNNLAFTLGGLMSDGLGWTPQYRYVSLTMNGSYRGLYGFADLVRMEAGRVPGSPASGSGDGSDGEWLMEVSNKERPYATDAAPDPGFTTPNMQQWVIYDDPEEPGFVQHRWVEDRFDEFEAALVNEQWSLAGSLANYSSFADWYLINELLSNGDARNLWSSAKVHTVNGGKINMGPLWDHDLSMGNRIGAELPPTQWHLKGNTSWIDDLWRDEAWVVLLQERWERIVTLLEGGLPLGTGGTGSVNDFFQTNIDIIGDYARADDEVWGTDNGIRDSTFDIEIESRRTWLHTRINWLTESFPW